MYQRRLQDAPTLGTLSLRFNPITRSRPLCHQDVGQKQTVNGQQEIERATDNLTEAARGAARVEAAT